MIENVLWVEHAVSAWPVIVALSVLYWILAARFVDWLGPESRRERLEGILVLWSMATIYTVGIAILSAMGVV